MTKEVVRVFKNEEFETKDNRLFVLLGEITAKMKYTPAYKDYCPSECDIIDKSINLDLECVEIDENGNEIEVFNLPQCVEDWAINQFFEGYEYA